MIVELLVSYCPGSSQPISLERLPSLGANQRAQTGEARQHFRPPQRLRRPCLAVARCCPNDGLRIRITCAASLVSVLRPLLDSDQRAFSDIRSGLLPECMENLMMTRRQVNIGLIAAASTAVAEIAKASNAKIVQLPPPRSSGGKRRTVRHRPG